MRSIAILGATGVIAQGAALAFLKKGFHVVVTSRSPDRLQKLYEKLSARTNNFSDAGKLDGVVGDFESVENAEKIRDEISFVLGGTSPTHVMNSIGFFSAIRTPLSATTPEDLLQNLARNGLWASMRANSAFVSKLKGDGSDHSLITLSSGFAHSVYVPNMWAATLKNAFSNQIAMTLSAELKATNISYKHICAHFALTPFGEKKNQLGVAGTDTEQFGEYFVAAAEKKDLTGTICLASFKDAQKLISESQNHQ